MRHQADVAAHQSSTDLHDWWPMFWRDSQECKDFREALAYRVKLRLVKTHLRGWYGLNKKWLKGAVADFARELGLSAYEEDRAGLVEVETAVLRVASMARDTQKEKADTAALEISNSYSVDKKPFATVIGVGRAPLWLPVPSLAEVAELHGLNFVNEFKTDTALTPDVDMTARALAAFWAGPTGYARDLGEEFDAIAYDPDFQRLFQYPTAALSGNRLRQAGRSR